MSQESPSSNQGSAPPEEEDESREGNETNLGRLPSLSRPYQPITTAHQEVVDEVDKRLHNFIYDEYEAGEKGEDVGPAPIAITGAYGSGKTQLEYHIFRRAWEEGVPAVYIGAPSEMLSELACCTFKISSPDGGLLPIDESLNEEGRNSVQFLERKSSSAA